MISPSDLHELANVVEAHKKMSKVWVGDYFYPSENNLMNFPIFVEDMDKAFLLLDFLGRLGIKACIDCGGCGYKTNKEIIDAKE